jgi:hypothetical protein
MSSIQVSDKVLAITPLCAFVVNIPVPGFFAYPVV